jgi:hypothetical protein
MKRTKLLIVGAAVTFLSNPVARAAEPDLELRQNRRTSGSTLASIAWTSGCGSMAEPARRGTPVRMNP